MTEAPQTLVGSAEAARAVITREKAVTGEVGKVMYTAWISFQLDLKMAVKFSYH